MSTTAVPDPELVETTTQLALEEKGNLKKSLRRLDMVGFTVCAFVGLDTLGTVAANGPQGFTWLAVLAVLFVLPYGLLMSEVGSAFTQEGGPYEWVKLAFGRLRTSVRSCGSSCSGSSRSRRSSTRSTTAWRASRSPTSSRRC